MTEAPADLSADLVVVGGGPAGMMAGLLFARAGVKTLVLEKHGDFLRDFRGDTVHPSTLELFRELGLLEALLARSHDRVERLSARMAGEDFLVADFTHLPASCRFIAIMPQWDFLDCVADAARRLPGFALRMGAEAVGVTRAGGRITGVALADGSEIAARLVIAADGRRSVLRAGAALPLEDLGAPMDVFWFRLPKLRTQRNQTVGVFEAGRILVTIDRGDYWQCAYVFAKGSADAVRARGIAAFRDDVAQAAPELRAAAAELTGWGQVKLLSVALDRLTRWHCPGLLAIGDAAHAMSPVGGVGINLAIQDAVAAANLLAGPMAAGQGVDGLLARVQARRMFPTRVTQAIQRIAQRRIIGRVLAADLVLTRAPLALRAIRRFPVLARIPARVVGLGVRPEHVRSPVAGS